MSIFALATAPGISGLAVIRLSGKEALKVTKDITKIKKIKPRIANFSTFYDSKNKIIDKGIFIFYNIIPCVTIRLWKEYKNSFINNFIFTVIKG